MRSVFFFLAFAGLHAQAQSILFGAPNNTPALPACGTVPFTVTQNTQIGWRAFCSNGAYAPGSGTVTGTGTGYCQGNNSMPVQGYCHGSTEVSGIGYVTDPYFKGQFKPSGGQDFVYAYIDSVSGPANANPPAGTSGGCAIPNISSGPSTNTPIPNCNAHTPVVIDPTGVGFHLTDIANGVSFREHAADNPVQMSWTDPAYGNAWLVRPNADGSVTSLAQNLFGDLSPQPPSSDPNGYSALAARAAAEGCLISTTLSSQTCPQLWSELRLWKDSNQDGVAQFNELQTLEQAGVHEISLAYHLSSYIDPFGNVFRYVSSIQDAAGSKDRRTYDVFLEIK